MPDTDSDLDIENPSPAPAPQAATTLRVAPALSTTDDPTSFNFAAPIATPPTATAYPKPTTDASLRGFFEIDRTVKELKVGGWTRIALQFPDELLGLGAARVCEIIQEEVNSFEDEGQRETEKEEVNEKERIKKKAFILADTSYGSCCVDEIAAQHISADVLVHYGRACLSPTTRLPVIYIFTNSPLNHSSVISGFTETFPKDENKDKKIILMADVMYTSHLSILAEKLKTDHGYTGIWEANVVHNPGALLPNRTLPEECVVGENDGEEEKQEKARRLREEWGVFHVGTPMPSLLLVLASRVGSIHVYPSPPAIESGINSNIIQATTSLQTMPLLRRRYALLTHIRSASIIGILVSTLTVKNYLSLISLLQRLIHSKGKKSYMVVVGKVNPEKLANFSEIEGWVGVGCWEQGVVGGALERGDGGREFWRGVVTPWELGVALGGMGEYDEDVDEEGEEGRGKRKEKRWEWNGEWITDFDTLLAMDPTGGDVGGKEKEKAEELPPPNGNNTDVHKDEDFYNPLSQVPESAPPAFDLRTGRYSSYSSSFSTPPIQSTPRDLQLLSKSSSNSSNSSSTLTNLPNHNANQIAIKGGVFSPAAEFLREKRTWKGLVVGYEEEDPDSTGTGGAPIEVGRSGVARGYTVGDEVAESHRR